MRALLVLVSFALACGGGKHCDDCFVGATVEHRELTPHLQRLTWWLGDWQGHSGEEHWVAAGGAIYGVALADDSFEVMVVDDGDGPGRADGLLRFIAMPGGKPGVEFRATNAGDLGTGVADSITFENPTHDDPKSITYQRRGLDSLHAIVQGATRLELSFDRMAASRAPALEANDRSAGTHVRASGVRGTFAYTVGVGPQRSYARVWKQANSEWTVAFEATRPIHTH